MGKFSGKMGKAKSYTPEARAVLVVNGIDDPQTNTHRPLKNLEAGSYLHGFVDVYTPHLPHNPTALIKFLLKGKSLEHGYKTDSEGNIRIDNDKEKWLKEKTKFVVAPMQPCPMTAPGGSGMYILRYPISYQLKDSLCDSFDIGRHNSQFCKYELKVKVKYHNFHLKLKSSNRDLDIMGRRPTYEQLTTAPPMKKDDKNSLFGGEIEAEARCDAYCYMEGQVINITANVHNKTSSMLQTAEITLVEKCCYPNVNRNTNHAEMRKSKVELVSKKLRALEIAPGERRTLQFALPIPNTVEPPSTGLKSKHGEVKISHVAKVRFDVSMGKDCRLRVPIIIAPNPARYAVSLPLQHDFFAAQMAQMNLGGAPLPNGYAPMCIPPPPPPAWNFHGPSMLAFELVSASDLPKMDVGLMGIGGKADPYVTVFINDKHVRTSAIMSNQLNPRYNETYHFKLSPEEARAPISVLLNCYDHDDLSKDDKIGSGRVTVQLSSQPKQYEVKLEYTDKKGKVKDHRGKVQFMVHPWLG